MTAPSYVFESAARRIVEYKWDNAQKYVQIEALIYLFNAYLLVIDTWYYCAKRRMKWFILGFNFILQLKFILYMYLFTTFKFRRECSYHIEYEGWNQFKYYLTLFFTNWFNIFDVLGQTFICFYCIRFLRHHGEDDDTEDYILKQERSEENYYVNLLHVLAMFFVMIRGCLSTFRLHGKTRHMVGMILQVFHDIQGFLFILMSSTVVFSVIFLFLQRNMLENKFSIPDYSIFESLHMAYNMMFANFTTDFEIFTIVGFLFYLSGTLFMIVIMLNLLISIISDTFDRI